jgi:hypothetical protein
LGLRLVFEFLEMGFQLCQSSVFRHAEKLIPEHFTLNTDDLIHDLEKGRLRSPRQVAQFDGLFDMRFSE